MSFAAVQPRAWTNTFFTGRAIVTPVKAMTEAMGRLAKGDTAIEVKGAERSDEIGEMATAVQVFKDNAIEKARLDAKKEKEQAAKEAIEDAKGEIFAELATSGAG